MTKDIKQQICLIKYFILLQASLKPSTFPNTPGEKHHNTMEAPRMVSILMSNKTKMNKKTVVNLFRYNIKRSNNKDFYCTT